MKNKILCLVLIIAVVCSVFVISASAEDEYVIEAGTYKFNDTLTTPTFSSVYLDFLYNTSDSNTVSGYQMKVDSYLSVKYLFFVSSSSNNRTYDLGSNIWRYDFFKTIIIETAQTVDSVFYDWFMSNTTLVVPPISTGILSAGYYRLILPIDVQEPTWIGDGNTIWYDIRGRVITDDSIRALSFHRLGVQYFVNEGVDYGEGVWGIVLRVDTNTNTNLEVMSITFDRNTNLFYWSYNELVLDGFVGVALDGDYEVNNDFYNLFYELFEPYDYVYTGNPWFDIVDGVVDALKIDVFGSFSPWDILITFIGISVFIWLLKVLAGG